MFRYTFTISMFVLTALCGCGTSAPTPKPVDTPPPSDTKVEAPEPPKAEQRGPAPIVINLTEKPPTTYIGSARGPDGLPKKVHTVLVTRKSDTVYQGLVRYEPRAVAVTDAPGVSDLREYFAAGGAPLPPTLLLLEQETEVLLDNLSLPLRSITSSKMFLNPQNGHVVAYDIANTSGGQPQRFVGHLTRRGIHIEVFRGLEYVDQHDLPFVSRDTFIPYEMEFIHQWYSQNPEALAKQEAIKFSIFLPEVMSYVLLVAKPRGDQMIPIKDTNYECARYEIVTASQQALDGMQAKQEMWFDKRSGLLQRREDFETSLAPGDAPVTERGMIDDLKRMTELTVRPPVLAEKALPYDLDRTYTYFVKTHDKDLGRISMRFNKDAQGLVSTANVNLEGEGVAVSRNETATTHFDSKMLPVDYRAEGTEKAETTAKYMVSAKLNAGRVELSVARDYDPNKPLVPVVKTPEEKTEEIGWDAPLKRVPLSDEEAQAEIAAAVQPRSMQQALSRTLSPGTFLYDFNRVEHLAAFAQRLPLPPDAKEGEAEPVAFQKVALFAVRQNRGGVVQFEIRREPQPVLTERQKKRLAINPSSEPKLYIAACNSPIMPCRMLLTAEGVILEMTLKFGNNDITYTLDHPIMQKRAERARKQEMQVGPIIVRPPWY